MKQAKRMGRQPIPSGTWVDYAKRLFPNANDRTADAVVWACTAFPFVTTRLVMRQLERARRQSRGDVHVALRRAHRALAAYGRRTDGR
jgi:glutamate racemase